MTRHAVRPATASASTATIRYGIHDKVPRKTGNCSWRNRNAASRSSVAPKPTKILPAAPQRANRPISFKGWIVSSLTYVMIRPRISSTSRLNDAPGRYLRHGGVFMQPSLLSTVFYEVRRTRRGHQTILCVDDACFDERDHLAGLQDGRRAGQVVPQSSGSDHGDLHLGVGDAGLAVTQRRHDRGAHRRVGHGREKSTLHDARGVEETVVHVHGPDRDTGLALVNARETQGQIAIWWNLQGHGARLSRSFDQQTHSQSLLS